MVYSRGVSARDFEYGGREFNPGGCTRSRRPNFLRKGGYATGKNDCLELSHI